MKLRHILLAVSSVVLFAPESGLSHDKADQLGKVAQALAEFEVSLQETPNRYRGLWGAARAAEGAGDRQKAAGYFAKVVELTKNADSSRPEIARARANIAQR